MKIIDGKEISNQILFTAKDIKPDAVNTTKINQSATFKPKASI